ncbi:ATP-dependent protease ATPase subunit HslU [Geosporobacter ferrireducens]|uniref:ATP-dependent protease ATPase subunit HslU n=1 Tax=Geosporobacter ferrireducens TaxID=1424294 RepID=A0A1D8GBJ7_9FIRM|nr:ATP-dependent protease ATPase subunit HslU [Geosporobacter ferrireducens]AOT68289.1 HslU--HslV peptidase ATPase subunit [Geosporobacter ferrireducens]MTI57288.1 ATP-dependent protease ATPase subunit HslU [Geosporobacter ferrireducens]
MKNLTPREIVTELNKYIIGQQDAKRSVAVALRNRYRRSLLPDYFKEEIKPKNILMMGPTGVGKTEIARRLARLVDAPFVKVEATKFTEVGYVGRDVESMIRDLIETSIRMVKNRKIEEKYEIAKKFIDEKIIDILCPMPKKNTTFRNPLEALFGGGQSEEEESSSYQQELTTARLQKEQVRKQLEEGLLENEMVEIEVEENGRSTIELFSGTGNEEMNINVNDLLGGILPKKTKKRKLTIKEARKILLEQEAQKLIDMDEVVTEAIENAEQNGIIFLDEIDKIASSSYKGGPDVSREGVQRDILPIVEGSTVITKYGPVKTDHILFIGAGAFHISKITDLIPELQGRFPIRVKLENLSRDNFREILTAPENALIKQYKMLLETEGIKIHFHEEAINEIANIAYLVNEQTENIGARRLHTVLEKLLEDISFEITDIDEEELVIDKAYVEQKLSDHITSQDLNKYII